MDEITRQIKASEQKIAADTQKLSKKAKLNAKNKNEAPYFSSLQIEPLLQETKPIINTQSNVSKSAISDSAPGTTVNLADSIDSNQVESEPVIKEKDELNIKSNEQPSHSAIDWPNSTPFVTKSNKNIWIIPIVISSVLMSLFLGATYWYLNK